MDSYSNTLELHASSQQVYDAITTEKGLIGWWTEQVEIYPEVGGTATFRFGKDTYAVMKIAKLTPPREVIWKCVEQYFPTKGTDKTDEWVGTSIRFQISEESNGVVVLSFIHAGLTENLFCYNECKKGWDFFLGSLKNYIETGKGRPYIHKK